MSQPGGGSSGSGTGGGGGDANVRSSWTAFAGAEYVEWALLLDGSPLGAPVHLPGDATHLDFYAQFAPALDRYAVHVRGVYPVTPATLSML